MKRRWVVGCVLVAACGGHDTLAPDAKTSVADAAADAHDVDAAVAPVRITARQGGSTPGPDPGAIAIFTDPSGTVVYDGPVDANGEASAVLPDGGEVTVIQNSDVLTTFRRVKPGDSLVAGPSPGVLRTWVMSSDTMSAQYSYPSMLLTHEEFATRCGGAYLKELNPATLEVKMFPDCKASTFDLLGITNTSPPKFIWDPGIQYAAHGSITLPAWTDMATTSIEVTGVPAGLSSLEVARWSLVHGVPLRAGSNNAATPPAGNASLAVEYPPNAGDGTVFQVIARKDPAYREIDQRVQTVMTAGAIALSTMLPEISNVVATTTGATWTETGSGTPDARVVEYAVNTDAGTILWWIIDAGTTAGAVALPALPPAHAALLAHPMMPSANVYLVDYSNLSGYDDARALGAALVDPIDQLDAFTTTEYVRTISSGR